MLMIYSKGYNMRRIVILLVTILVFSGCENFLDLTPKSEVLGDCSNPKKDLRMHCTVCIPL